MSLPRELIKELGVGAGRERKGEAPLTSTLQVTGLGFPLFG